jgi:hypothetical protein
MSIDDDSLLTMMDSDTTSEEEEEDDHGITSIVMPDEFLQIGLAVFYNQSKLQRSTKKRNIE